MRSKTTRPATAATVGRPQGTVRLGGANDLISTVAVLDDQVPPHEAPAFPELAELPPRYCCVIARYPVAWGLLIVDVTGDSGGWQELEFASFGDCLARALEWTSRGLARLAITPDAWGC